jgi:DNA-binding CsgD family transcriptional regulator
LSITDTSKNSMGALSAALDALLFASSANDLCRTVVHGGFTGVETHGCHIYVLDHNSNLKQVAGYGLAHASVVDELSAWDDSPAAACIREKDLVFKAATKETGRSLICIPFLKDSIPVGCVCLTVSDGVNGVPEIPGLLTVVSKLGALYLETSGVKTSGRKDTSATTNGEDLTKRQIQILEMMSDGMSNVEIAREMLLSESSIRQETVRIYRALGVGGRAEASKKAKALGIISKNGTPPPAVSRAS